MFQLNSLVKRNIKIFLRDKAAVFFSFLSVLILLILYFLFLRNSYETGLDDLTSSDKTFLSMSQMMSGVLVINTLTLALGMMGNMVNDIYYHKFDSFLVTPTKRSTILLSYYVSSIAVTFILSIFMWLLTVLYVFITAGVTYSFLSIVLVSLLLLVYTFISASIMIFIISFVKSINAFGTISGVLGTFIGFVSGIYMPLSILPKAVSYVASLNPFTHMTILMRRIILEKPFERASTMIPEEGMALLKEPYGYNEIGVLGMDVSLSVIMIVIVLLSLVLFYITMKRLSKKN